MQINKEENITKIKEFLEQVGNDFPIPLTKKVDLDQYVKKAIERGINLSATDNGKIIGICMGYVNDKENYTSYISTIAILPQYRKLGIGRKLISEFKKYAINNNMNLIRLYVHKNNNSAIQFYEKNGFTTVDIKPNFDYNITMELSLKENILLTSVGRRSYLVQYFKQAIGNLGEVHVSNSSDISPAFEYADKSVVTPLIYDDTYIDFLKDYCKNNNIKIIISLFDIDLPVLSKHKSEFEEIGTKVIVSNYNVVEMCNDKWKTYAFLKENGFNIVNTYINLEKAIEDLNIGNISYPVIIKPRWGMGSISVMQVDNEEELKVLYNKAINQIKQTYLKYEAEANIQEAVLIQEKIIGQEYGLDIINDLNGNYQTTIVKQKYAMRAGETDCAKVVDNQQLKNLGKTISEKLRHVANMDVDVFLAKDKPYILEMNARFGGGYPFSHMAGVDLPKAIMSWYRNEDVDKGILTEKKINTLFHKDINIIELQNKVEIKQ